METNSFFHLDELRHLPGAIMGCLESYRFTNDFRDSFAEVRCGQGANSLPGSVYRAGGAGRQFG